jgi:dTMP kinase
VREIIKPALDKGELVICDRYIDSSVAYQGYARGLGAPLVKQINAAAVDGCMPDLTVFINLRPSESFRTIKTEDRLEQENAEFHERVYDGFIAEMGASNGRIVGIKPDLNKYRTSSNIVALLRERGIIK